MDNQEILRILDANAIYKLEDAYKQGRYDEKNENPVWHTVPVSEYKPKSAKQFPVWIKVKDSDGVDMVWMTADEKYFVSTDHMRVYTMDEVVSWTMVDIPIN